MNVTIIGAGNMGRGIATRLLSGGQHVTLIDQNEAQAVELAAQLQASARGGATVSSARKDEVIILAVYYPVIAAVIQEYGKPFDGKVVVDITNTLNDTFTEPRFDNSSGAEEIAKLLPNSRLVKAFNTTFAGTLIGGQVAGQPLDVLIASDDTAAKALVINLVQSGGLRAVDAGPLRRARQLEAIGCMHIIPTVTNCAFPSLKSAICDRVRYSPCRRHSAPIGAARSSLLAEENFSTLPFGNGTRKTRMYAPHSGFVR